MVPAPPRAVFLSYASQDADAARRLCDALRAGGIEVWFDQTELRGGDAWDQKIRQQIKECALFMPLISANTQARPEGYFRLEWRLADQRTHLMGRAKAFVVPVGIDDTRAAEADVPDSFLAVQWLRLPGGEPTSAFVERVAALVQRNPADGVVDLGPDSPASTTTPPARMRRVSWLNGVAVMLVAATVFAWWWWRDARAPENLSLLSPAAQLVQQARALIDDDPLAIRENFVTAERLGQRAAELEPQNGEAWAVLGQATLTLISHYRDDSPTRLAAARMQAERAILLAPDSLEAGLTMAFYEMTSGVAAADIERRLLVLHERAPTDRRVLQMLSATAEMRRDRTAALAWLDRAIAQPGGDAELLAQRGGIYWELGRFTEAEEAFERSFALQPNALASHLKLLLLVYGWGDLAGARAWLEKIPPVLLREDRIAMFASRTWYWSREPERALKVLLGVTHGFFGEGVIFRPVGYDAGCAHLLAGRARAAEVEWRAALRLVEQRLEQEPNDAHLAIWRAMLHARLGDPTAAVEWWETSRQLERANSGVWGGTPAELLVLLGRTDEALDVCDQLVTRTRPRWTARLSELRYDPVYDPLRAHPRFQEMVDRGLGWLAEMREPAAAP